MSNLVILLSDEHNPLYSEPYGHSGIQTPAMRTLAEQGTVFDAAYCPSPLCMPSRSAFLSGRRVHKIQTYSNCNALVNPGYLSFGAALARQGVHTAYIGKTDVYAPGRTLGFTEMMLPGDRAFPGDSHHRRHPMSIRHGAATRARGFGADEQAGAGDVRCVDTALEWIRGTGAALDTPWVLVVNVGNPHFPHIAPPEFWNLYDSSSVEMPRHGSECESARHPYAEMIRRHFETDRFTPEQVRGLRHGYLACISFVDHQLGRLADMLATTGLKKTTNLVYTSDHGEMLGKFGMWWKCSLYEDAVRVPMIASGPDFPIGRRVQTPVDLHDLQASLFAATSTTPPEGWLGRPLWELPELDENRVVFSEYHGHGAPGSSFMVRKGRWKYLHYTQAPAQLFDLDSDPEELCNLADSNPRETVAMETALRAICLPERENARAERFIEEQLRFIAQTTGPGMG